MLLVASRNMNFQQLRYIREAVRRNLNLTEAANALHTSQPGVSKQIRELEIELGVRIFERYGRRLTALTPPGREMIGFIERILIEAENIRRIGERYATQDSGKLTIATTHTQARYVLPKTVAEFRSRFPEVRLSLLQGNPASVAQWVLSGDADIGIATESLNQFDDLIALPGYQWSHALVVRRGHPLADGHAPSLAELSKFPIVTYNTEFAGRRNIDASFARERLQPDIVLTAIDSDVIKTYVSLGLGVGIIASVAFDSRRDQDLVPIDASHLFPRNTTFVAIRKYAYLRDFALDFIASFAPSLSADRVAEVLQQHRFRE
jgi:LysR family cys regulon transcriptional activator